MVKDQNKIEALLIRHEGKRYRPYDDGTGEEIRNVNVTIGVGCNLSSGMDDEEVMFLLKHRIERASDDVTAIFGDEVVDSLSVVRWAVLVNIAYALGRFKFLSFSKLRIAVETANFDNAAAEILDSAWARRVRGRSTELAQMMRSNRWPQWMQNAR